MESGTAVVETLPNCGVSLDANSPFHSDCLACALELLEVLREETQILRRFAGKELLALVPRKEYLVSELEWKLETARQTGSLAVSDSFKALLSEISELNASNGIFIEKSLSYWQGLLSIFSPPSYGPAGRTAGRVPPSPKGTAFRREI